MNNSLLSDLLIPLFSFFRDFLANFLSDFVVGVFLGVPLAVGVAWWVGKRLSELAGSEQRKAEKRARLEKAIPYLEILKVEIDYLVRELPEWMRVFKSTGRGMGFWISTARWDILKPSGELPWLLDPRLVVSLTLFYDGLMCANQGKDWLVRSWLVPVPKSVDRMDDKRESFMEMTLLGLERALDLGRDLPDKLDSEIRRLKAELQKP